jgi:DNA-binding CsgD family transcriptional regulator
VLSTAMGREAEARGLSRPIGREQELAALRVLIDPSADARAFIVTGSAGIGKTELWETATDDARSRGVRVLEARPSEAEAQLAFAALCDLMDGIDTAPLDALPMPQRHALDEALLRAEPGEVPPEPHAVGLGFLNALRSLSAGGVVLVAVDDVQWLDSASADVLAFAARRLRDSTVRLLFAQRTGTESAVVGALGTEGCRHLEVGPLSLGATRRLLAERLGLTLPRRVLRRVFDAAHGNPLFVLQLGRTLAERGVPAVDEELEIPDDLEELVGTRVSELPEPVRLILVAAGLSGDLRRSQLAAVTDPSAVDEAFEAGLLVAEGDRVRPFHPLLSAAARMQAEPNERRALHAALAEAVTDETLRARHLALATELPDLEVAGVVEAAARRTRARGAIEDAAELAEHALRLTPTEAAEHAERLLLLGEYLFAFDPQRVVDLLATRADELPTGSARARAHLLLSDAGTKDLRQKEYHVERALAEDTADPAIRASVLSEHAVYTAVCAVEQIEHAEALALDALQTAAGDGQSERMALQALGWARALEGKRIADLHERFAAASDSPYLLYQSVDRIAAVQLAWRGDVQQARNVLADLRATAEARGEGPSSGTLLLHLTEVELRAANWASALDYANAFQDSLYAETSATPVYARLRALLAAGQGDPDEAERWVREVIADSEATGFRWDLLEAMRARGIAALLRRDPAQAVESLWPVWEHTRREGIDDPGVFPVAPDLVEGLVELGKIEEAHAVTQRLDELATEQDHPWGLVTATRCRSLIALAARAAADDAAEGLRSAAVTYGELGLPFEHARSSLALGRAERRRRKWASARAALAQAADAFDEIGSTGWSELARAAVARVGARKPVAPGELTPAERRVAELAAEGRANKEIAAALFVTINTVEVHLSRAYGKLGVRSRSQLAKRLSSPT